MTAVSLFLVFGAARSEAGLVPAGEDFFSSRGTVSVEIYDPFYPGGFTEVISLSSNGFPLSHVHRDAQVVTTINTEMVSLDLAGISANVGYVHLRVGAGNATPVIEGGSFGQITNVVTSGNNFVSGDSYFNILFELDVQSYGVTLYNKLADPDVVVANGIFRLPPFNRTYQSFQTVALWADVGVVGDHSDDVVVGRLFAPPGGGAATGHAPTPEPSSVVLVVVGMLTLGVAKRRGWSSSIGG